jgi:hypothetical protein
LVLLVSVHKVNDLGHRLYHLPPVSGRLWYRPVWVKTYLVNALIILMSAGLVPFPETLTQLLIILEAIFGFHLLPPHIIKFFLERRGELVSRVI